MLVRRFLPVLLLTLSLAPAAAYAADTAPASIAHIRLSGGLDETPLSDDPLFSRGSENFKSKLDRIAKALKDDKVHALLLELDGLSVSWGKLDELRRAVTDVRKGGKKVFAYLESGDSKDYLLGLACDEICLPESGWLMLTGLRAEMSFYKDVFDKVGVKADMLQMGDFKGAAEPYTRSGMSKELRHQMETVLDDFFEKSMVEAIVQARPAKKWTPEQVKKLIDNGPYTARRAADLGLVDRVAYPDQLEAIVKRALTTEELKLVKNYG